MRTPLIITLIICLAHSFCFSGDFTSTGGGVSGSDKESLEMHRKLAEIKSFDDHFIENLLCDFALIIILSVALRAVVNRVKENDIYVENSGY